MNEAERSSEAPQRESGAEREPRAEREAAPARAGAGSVSTVVSARTAAFLGFCIGALVNSVLLLGQSVTSRTERWLLHGYDAAHFVAAGLLAAGLVWALRRPRWTRARWVSLLALFAFAVALGAVVLFEDLENFSLRMAETAPPWLTLSLTTAAVAAWIPGAALLGIASRRVRFGRALALLLAVLGFVANGIVLPGDYHGVHAYLAWASATLAAAALTRLSVAPLARALPRDLPGSRALRYGWRALIGVAAASVLWFDPPSGVAVALSQSEGSALVPLVSELRGRVRGETASVAVVHQDAWFRDRSNEPPVPPTRPPLLPKNPVVMLITIDCLRHDIINSGEYDARFPNLAKLRNQSVVFTQARAAGTFTKISLSALFMGTYFSQQYWTQLKHRRIYTPNDDDSIRFTQLLQKAGFRTVNFASIPWLTSEDGVIRGFHVDERVPQPGSYTESPRMVERMLKELDQVGDRAAFLFMHLSDAHSPYELGGVKGDAWARYLGEVAFVDRALGDLFGALERPEFASRTALILSADHGEAFNEHGVRHHGVALYDEMLRIPLMIRVPGVRPRRVTDLVSLIDVGPTILDLVGLETPGHFMGQSLTPFLRGQNPTLTRPILAETRRIKTLVTPDGLKLIVDDSRRQTQLYDIFRDPEEKHNLADDPTRVDPLLARLRQFIEVHRLKRPGYKPPLVK